MADILTSSERSALMSKIRSKGNRTTELRMIQIFRAYKITGWRRNSQLPGKPDFVFPKARLCVFVDGCFWHGCPKCYRQPKSKKGFWREKVTTNKVRDKIVNGQLRRQGWHVMRFWECRIKNDTLARQSIAQRAAKADEAAFLKVLAKVPKGEPTEAWDKLPKASARK